jgi:hypothetical protein
VRALEQVDLHQQLQRLIVLLLGGGHHPARGLVCGAGGDRL